MERCKIYIRTNPLRLNLYWVCFVWFLLIGAYLYMRILKAGANAKPSIIRAKKKAYPKKK